MDINTLEEEYNAISSDKAEEADYFQSLKDQVEKLKVHEVLSLFSSVHSCYLLGILTITRSFVNNQ